MPKCRYCQFEIASPREPCPNCGYWEDKQGQLQDLKLTEVQQQGAGARRGEIVAATRPQARARSGSIESSRRGVLPFRPLYRPPMLLICVLDDDGIGGEWIRVRGDSFIIGRTEGDYRLPHEMSMSARHLEFARQQEGGAFFWSVRDLDSTNGTFARVERARLRSGQHILLGSRRYYLHTAGQGSRATQEDTSPPPARATQPWHVLAAAEDMPALVRLRPEGEAERYPLEAEEQWIGTDGRVCRIAIQGDRYLDARHARLYCKGRRWWIEDGGSVNGTWVAIKHIRIDTSAEIQVGEQRFRLKVP